MRTMEQVVLEFLQQYGVTLERYEGVGESRARLTRIVRELRPHVARIGDDPHIESFPPFDYRLLAGFSPRTLMLLMLHAAAMGVRAISD